MKFIFILLKLKVVNFCIEIYIIYNAHTFYFVLNFIFFSFGAIVRSERLGIIWNDHMDDFSIPEQKNFFGFDPSPSNYISPGKRPLSSMSPFIIYNKNTKQVLFLFMPDEK